jgi:predicted secreted protein
MSSRLLAAAAAALLLALPARGFSHDEPDALRRVSFQVERSRDVENDRVRAVLAYTDEDANAAALADRVNGAMTWALERAKRKGELKVQTGAYTTSPVYDHQRIVRWRASQQLWLDSGDVAPLTERIGELQEKLQVESVSFSVSPERRREVEDELIGEALRAYRARAELVREALGSSGFTLVQLSVNTPGAPSPQPYYGRGAAMAAAEAVTPPALEGGTSALTVSVNATIELE